MKFINLEPSDQLAYDLEHFQEAVFLFSWNNYHILEYIKELE